MVTIKIGCSHLKVDTDDATEQERTEVLRILTTKFRAKDKKKLFDPEVRRGRATEWVQFYAEEDGFLPTGFLPWLTIYFDKLGIEYEKRDYRKFPKSSEKFLENRKMGMFKPREDQIGAIDALTEFKSGGLISVATGVGKSLILAHISQLYPNSRILYLFDSLDLIDQARRKFVFDYGIDHNEIGIVADGACQTDRRLTFLSLMSWEGAMDLYPHIRVVAAEESHSTLRTPTAIKVNYMCTNASVKIGVSATNEDIDNPAEAMALRAIGGPVIYRAELADKIEDGTLASVQVEMIKIGGHIKQVNHYQDKYDKVIIDENDKIPSGWEKWRGQDDQGEWHTYRRKLKALGNESNFYVYNDHRNDIIAQCAKSHERALIICTRVEHCYELEKRIPGALVIKGKSDKFEEDLAKRKLSEDPHSVVIATNKWSKGIDIPALRTFINAAGGRSPTLLVQKTGRITRKDPVTGKESAKVIDFKDDFSALAIKQSDEREEKYKQKGLPVTVIQNI